jgi:hypothetical protein
MSFRGPEPLCDETLVTIVSCVLPNSNQHQIDSLRSPLILLPELEVVRRYIPRDVPAWCRPNAETSVSPARLARVSYLALSYGNLLYILISRFFHFIAQRSVAAFSLFYLALTTCL